MRRCSASDIVLKVLGLLLLTAAVLKGHELLTVPVANQDLWSWRPFLIFQVEFELALGIWLLSGLFKRLAWLAALTCFSLFCCITLYKGLTGAASCGCFGRIHVNPWITLAAIDLPALIVLALSRPTGLFAALRFLRKEESTRTNLKDFLRRVMAPVRSLIVVGFTLVVLSTTTPILTLNTPALVTSTYEVPQPETWVGQELPILKYIDIGEILRAGTWLLVFYHHDCPHCQEALPQYEQMARDLAGNEDLLRVAVIAIPPYGQAPIDETSDCTLGRLAETKEWFVTTPVVVLLQKGIVLSAWEQENPDLDTILGSMTVFCAT